MASGINPDILLNGNRINSISGRQTACSRALVLGLNDAVDFLLAHTLQEVLFLDFYFFFCVVAVLESSLPPVLSV